MYAHHEESSAVVKAPMHELFAHLDDQRRLAAHMGKRSWKMGWGKMDTVLDGERGRAVGSRITLDGRVFGIRLYLHEVVTVREPPREKAWETIGEPKLLVIGPYRMSFGLAPNGATTSVRVAIDYDLPAHGVGRWLGMLLGRSYAKWCTRQMARDAQRAFA